MGLALTPSTELVSDMNRQLAVWLRAARDRHEESYIEQVTDSRGNLISGGYYMLSSQAAASVVVGENNPIALVIACLLTAGYCEMWDFCDQVLGPEQTKGE